MHKYKFGNLVRVSKQQARKLYNAGCAITIAPCNLRPDSAWVGNCVTNKQIDGDFDRLINIFTYYNCSNETGRYPAFYFKEA